MPLSPGLLLLLLSGLQADTQVKEVRAMVGSDVELSCVYPQRNSFDLNDLYVYWQISDSNAVVTYHLSANGSAGHEDNRYKNRAHLSLDRMKLGDFSLWLQNITPYDAQEFKCLVFRKSLELKKVLESVVRLHVAANFSMPVVSPHRGAPQDQEVTFTCSSWNGYPRPNVYWINVTDNSLLDEALQVDNVSLNARGLYDVVSVLRIPRAPSINVRCCIENALLRQNLTVSSQTDASTEIPDRRRDHPANPHGGNDMVIFSVLAVLLVVAVMAVSWVCRSRCSRRRYTGPQAVTLEQELTDHA